MCSQVPVKQSMKCATRLEGCSECDAMIILLCVRKVELYEHTIQSFTSASATDYKFLISVLFPFTDK